MHCVTFLKLLSEVSQRGHLPPPDVSHLLLPTLTTPHVDSSQPSFSPCCGSSPELTQLLYSSGKAELLGLAREAWCDSTLWSLKSELACYHNITLKPLGWPIEMLICSSPFAYICIEKWPKPIREVARGRAFTGLVTGAEGGERKSLSIPTFSSWIFSSKHISFLQ